MNKTSDHINSTFGDFFKILRLRSAFETLQDFSEELDARGLSVDPSLLSHWQRGTRLPKDRQTVLLLLKIFTERGGITSPGMANRFSELTGMGYLTSQEMLNLFPDFHGYMHELPSSEKQTKMQIYFECSGRGLPIYGKQYQRIMRYLENFSNSQVNTSCVYDNVSPFYTGEDKDREKIFDNAMKFIQNADLMVIEITVHSLSMGYLLHHGLSLNKPVIALYRDTDIPYFASLIHHDKLQVLHYDDSNLELVLSQAISFLQHQMKKY